MKTAIPRRNFLHASLAAPLLRPAASNADETDTAAKLWPPFEEIETRLKNWVTGRPGLLKLEVHGKTAQGRALYSVHLNDPIAPESDKEHVLITAQHSGIERSGTTTILLLLEWLLSGEPMAREILKRQHIIAMPVVNPDGYMAGSHANSLGLDPYTAWDLAGPKEAAKSPEAVAVQMIMDRHQPEVHADVHGIDLAFPGHTMIEESGQAYSNVSLRSYHQGIVDQMNAAAEAEGYPSDRLEQDAERIFWGPELNSMPEKVWTGRSRPYAAIYCYSRYHSLALASEIAWERSGFLRHKRLLKIGNEIWPGEYYPGYPTRAIASNNYHHLTAYGRTAQQRRASRVELWNKQGQFTLAMNNPPTEGFVLYGCATSPAAAARWFKDKTLMEFASKLSEHPRVDAAPIQRLIERYPHPNTPGQWGPQAQLYLSGGQQKSEPSPIQYGLSLRLRIPYPKARILDVRLNGRPLQRSETDGYITWVARAFRYVQVNIAPEASRSEDFYLVTCEYDPGEKRQQGFWRTEQG
jgi:zinc carboxypeptidase